MRSNTWRGRNLPSILVRHSTLYRLAATSGTELHRKNSRVPRQQSGPAPRPRIHVTADDPSAFSKSHKCQQQLRREMPKNEKRWRATCISPTRASQPRNVWQERVPADMPMPWRTPERLRSGALLPTAQSMPARRAGAQKHTKRRSLPPVATAI